MTSIVSLLALVCLIHTARAAPPALTAPTAPTPPAPTSYGGQTLAVDLAGAGMMLSLAGPLPLIGAGTYVFGAPIVHLSHHRPGRAALSLVLHAGLPIGGAYLLGSSGDDDGAAIGAFIGLLGGMTLATAIDAAILARDDERASMRSWTPTVVATPGGATLGIAGTF